MLQKSQTNSSELLKPLCLFAFVLFAGNGLASTYADFSSTAGLSLVGAAAQNGNALRLTPAVFDQVGSAWLTQKQHVSAGFTTTFSFRFTDPAPPGADGISFTVQNLGIGAIANEQGTTNGLAISLNTFQYGDEVSDNFVGVYRNGYNDNSGRLLMLDLNPTPIRLKDGNTHTVSLTYSGSAFSMSIDAFPVFNNFAAALGSSVDGSGDAYVGFGSRTGLYWENHDLLNWSFNPIPEPGAAGLLAAGGLVLAWRRGKVKNVSEFAEKAGNA